MLQYSRDLSEEVLKDFKCGIPRMDAFIRDDLHSTLKEHPEFVLWIASDDVHGIVAMFVTSRGGFVDFNEEFLDLPSGKPWSYIDDNFEVNSASKYPTLEIDYLAVREDLRCKGFGREIIEKLTRQAREEDSYFLTVDAYHDRDYSAIGFYEKQGFFALREYSEAEETLRMAFRI